MNHGTEMTIEQDNIYSQLREYRKELQDDAKIDSVAMDALERVLNLEVTVFRLRKKLHSIEGWIFAINITLFIAFITYILR
jgi:hypothetical protein